MKNSNKLCSVILFLAIFGTNFLILYEKETPSLVQDKNSELVLNSEVLPSLNSAIDYLEINNFSLFSQRIDNQNFSSKNEGSYIYIESMYTKVVYPSRESYILTFDELGNGTY